MSRVLAEKCPECGWPTREETREFRDEKLAVLCCLNPRCEFFDWELPQGFEEEEDWDLFDDSQEWAMKQAEEMKAEFLSRKPIEVVIPISSIDVERWLGNQELSWATRESYRRLLLRFLKWLENRYEAR